MCFGGVVNAEGYMPTYEKFLDGNKNTKLVCNYSENGGGNGFDTRCFRQVKDGVRLPQYSEDFGKTWKYIWIPDGNTVLLPNTLKKFFSVSKIYGDVDAIHLKGWYDIFRDDESPINFKKVTLSWEGKNKENFLTKDIQRRLNENWLSNSIADFLALRF